MSYVQHHRIPPKPPWYNKAKRGTCRWCNEPITLPDGSPDRPWIHSIPGWHVLCDLCSEDYVLYEDEE